MNHQPFDTWLLEPNELSADQRKELENHLQTCQECRLLRKSVLRVDQIFKETPITPAPAGFSARFQASLAQRRKKAQQRQVRIAVLILLGAILVTGGIFFAYFLSQNSLTKMLGSLIQFISFAPQRLIELRYIVTFWIGRIPTSVFAIISAIIVFWTFLLLTPWVLTLMRIKKRQGVTEK